MVEVFGRTGGVEAALTVARERSGTQFDPDLVDAFCEQAPMVLTELDDAPSWDAVIAAEPALAREIVGEELDLALEAIGEFAELKSPSIMGHVHAVRELVTEAATSFGLPDADAAQLRRVACVYDLGRLGVPNTVWDKPGPLTQSELERVRTHPYLSERMLAFAPSLAGLGRIAVQHHERLDGSGYPRGLSGEQIGHAARDCWPRRTCTRRCASRGRTGRLVPRRTRRRVAPRGHRRATRRRSGGQRATGRGAPGRPTPRVACGPDHARGRGAQAPGAWPVEQADRSAARDLAEDRRQSRRAHLPQDRRLQPRAGQPVRDASRADARRAGTRRRLDLRIREVQRSGECPMTARRSVASLPASIETRLGGHDEHPGKHHGAHGQRVHANGIDIHYLDQGEGEPLVLLHGGLVSTNPIWTGVPVAYAGHMDTLAEHFRVIAPDTRGCGRTVHPGGPISFDLLADDVAAMIAALGLERPLIAGFSDGAITATILGIRHPDTVRAIVNHAGFDEFDPEAPTFAMMRQILGGSPDATEPDPDAAARGFEASEQMRPMFELMKRDQDSGQGDGHWRTYLRLSWDRTTQHPGYTYADLAKITVPTLILAGDRDDFCTVEQAVTAYRQLADGELAILPGHGHYIPPAAIQTTVEFFARRLAAQS